MNKEEQTRTKRRKRNKKHQSTTTNHQPTTTNNDDNNTGVTYLVGVPSSSRRAAKSGVRKEVALLALCALLTLCALLGVMSIGDNAGAGVKPKGCGIAVDVAKEDVAAGVVGATGATGVLVALLCRWCISIKSPRLGFPSPL